MVLIVEAEGKKSGEMEESESEIVGVVEKTSDVIQSTPVRARRSVLPRL
jgi:hypothetical protein